MRVIAIIGLAAALAATPAPAQNDTAANADVATVNTVDANTAAPVVTDANGMVVAPGAPADANMAMPAPAPVETAAPAPARAPARQGFPWGAIGLVGLIGLLGRRRRRD